MFVSLQEMALKKLSTKRSRKDAPGEYSSAAQPADTDFERHRFRSAKHQQHFETIEGWSFLRERQVQRRDDEFPNFQEEVARRRWAPLVMQSDPARALDRRLQVDWAKDPREGPRVLMSFWIDFGPMG